MSLVRRRMMAAQWSGYKNLFNVEYILNENGKLDSSFSTSLETNPIDIEQGKRYLLITKGTCAQEGYFYSSIYFGEDDLQYGTNHHDVLSTVTGEKCFEGNVERKFILTAKKTCTVTRVIVHGVNNVKDVYSVEEFGLFALEDSSDGSEIQYVPYI